MKKNRGWIKLHRQLQSSAIWNTNEPFDRRSAWIDLLLMVNHEERVIIVDGKKKVIKEGQHWTSYRKLAERWKWSIGRVKRYFGLLSELGMVTATGTQSGTLLTIEKYGFFQGGRNTDGYTDEHADGLSDGLSDGLQTRTNRRTKYNKNEEEGAGGAEDLFSDESGRVYE